MWTRARHWGTTGLVVAAAGFALAAPAPAQQLQPGEIVVADAEADPNNDASDAAIFRVDPTTGVATVLGESLDLNTPRGIAIDGAGNVLVADPLADLPGPGTGAIFRIVPGQAPTVFATSAQFSTPTGVAVDGVGNVIVTDLSANPDNLMVGNTGAIFRIAPGQQPAVLKTSTSFVDPWSSTLDAQGNILVTDRAGPIFRFTPDAVGDPTIIGTIPDEPSASAVEDSGQVLTVAPDASPPGNAPMSGSLSRFSPEGAIDVLPSSGFSDPFGVDIDADGCALVADSGVDPNGGGLNDGLGAIFRFVPGQAPAIFSASTLFRQPGAVAVNPGGTGCLPRPGPVTNGEFATPLPIAEPSPTCKKGQKLKKGKCVKKKRKKK